MGIKSISLAVTTVSIAVILSSTAAQAVTVQVGDLEWRQLTDARGFSYDELASIYDTSTGQLSGSTTTLINFVSGEVDFAGWTWASSADAYSLFEQIPGHNVIPTSLDNWDPFNGGEANSTLGDFFDASFEPTEFFEETLTWGWSNWYGWTRDLSGIDGVRVSVERNVISSDDGDTWLRNQDQIYYSSLPTSTAFADGVWLYREASVVPVPAAVWLFGSGLIGLIGLARRKA